jgi:hypothetical protein
VKKSLEDHPVNVFSLGYVSIEVVIVVIDYALGGFANFVSMVSIVKGRSEIILWKLQ